jgi:MtN3 and saliva related transmembrane protein
MAMFNVSSVNFLGWIASMITVVYTTLGLPAQIVKNFKSHSTAGLSLVLFTFLTGTFVSWVLYGIVKPDWFIVVPNGLGALCGCVIVGQIIYYQARKNSET